MFDNVAIKLKEARINAKMSQDKLAHSLGFRNGQLISNCERSKCSLPLKKVRHFCYLTDTPRDEIKAAWMRDQSVRFDEAVNDQA